MSICKDIYAKTTSLKDDNLLENDDINQVLGKLVSSDDSKTAKEEYNNILQETFGDLEVQNIDLINVFQSKIGVDPTDDTLVDDKNNSVPQWKYVINQRIISNESKLADIPNGTNLAELLYRNDLFNEITGENSLPNLLSNVTSENSVNKYGYCWTYKVDSEKLQEYKNSQTIVNKIKVTDISNLFFNEDSTINEKTLEIITLSLSSCSSNNVTADLAQAQLTIAKAEKYLRLNDKKLVDVMDANNPNYMKLPTSLWALKKWYLENDKIIEGQKSGLDMFDYNLSNEKLIDGFNLDKIENYAKAPKRLGLTDFAADTITSKLGISRLSDIPTNQTLTDLINHVCPTTLTHNDYNDRYTESEQFRRINSKLNNKISDAELDILQNAEKSKKTVSWVLGISNLVSLLALAYLIIKKNFLLKKIKRN